MDLQLKGKTALVTGGSEGIGKGIAMVLAKEGVDVAICARRMEPLQKTADEISYATGRKVIPIVADLTKDADAKKFVEQAHKKNIDLGFDLQPTRVMGDHFLLRDLIDNLIDNAIRYSPRGGRVTVSSLHGKDGGIFAVEDSGPGIAPSEQELIFNRFHRLDDSVAGNGLGLAIVRDITKDHGARITVEPGAAGGTIFSVHFPFPILGAPSKLPA